MAEKHLFLTDYKGDPHLGFYGIATDEYAVLAQDFKKSKKLGVETVCETPLCNTSLTGLFAAGNSNGILVPESASDHELERLKEAGIDYLALDSRHNAVGNIVLVNDHGCIISTHLAEEKEKIEDFLQVRVEIGQVAGLDIVGSAGIATNKGVLLHRETSEAELGKVEKVLDVEGDIGTVNFGSPYVGTGIVTNSITSLVGNDTKGPETARIEKTLGFLD